jgi:hypothetical protein
MLRSRERSPAAAATTYHAASSRLHRAALFEPDLLPFSGEKYQRNYVEFCESANAMSSIGQISASAFSVFSVCSLVKSPVGNFEPQNAQKTWNEEMRIGMFRPALIKLENCLSGR